MLLFNAFDLLARESTYTVATCNTALMVPRVMTLCERNVNDAISAADLSEVRRTTLAQDHPQQGAGMRDTLRRCRHGLGPGTVANDFRAQRVRTRIRPHSRVPYEHLNRRR